MLKWALPLAASLFLVLLLVPGRDVSAPTPVPLDDTAGLSAQDRADDELLRDVEWLAMGEDSATEWDETPLESPEEPS